MNYFKTLFKANWDMAVTLLLTVTAFMVLFGWPALNIYNTDLVVKGGDFTVSYLGSVFYRIDEWRWPIFTHLNLAYPYGISVHGTDGSPLLSIIFKALHSWFGLSPHVQYVGIWMLVCYILQAVASVLIFRHAFTNKFYVILGSLFFVASPIMMMRVFVHINLMPHFILLFAILLWMNNTLTWKQWVYMGILMSLSILTCPYFLPMICGFFAVLIYNALFRDKVLSVTHMIIGTASLVSVFLIWYMLLGMASTEQVLSSGGWRTLGLNLTALFNPIWSQSQFFTSTTPKADFDADNYFGLGLLITLILMFPSVKSLFARDNLKKNAIFVLLLTGLFVFSLSSQVKFGTTVVLDYKPGDLMNWIGGVFRYSGRFFWPIWYLLAFFILKQVPLSFPKWAKVLLPVLLIIQLWDLYPTYLSKHRFVTGTQPAKEVFVSKEWDRLANTYQNVFILAHNKNYRDIWKWAIKHKKNVNYGFLNRPSKKTLDLVNDVQEEILSGYVSDASYFYVIDSDLKKKIDEVVKINPQVQKLKDKIQTIDTYEILEYDQVLHKEALEGKSAYTSKTIPVQHNYWKADLIQTAPYRVYRQIDPKTKDFATIVQRDNKVLKLKWDRYGVEVFEMKSDGVYHQVTTPTPAK